VNLLHAGKKYEVVFGEKVCICIYLSIKRFFFTKNIPNHFLFLKSMCKTEPVQRNLIYKKQLDGFWHT